MEMIEKQTGNVCVIQLSNTSGERARFDGFQQRVRERLVAGQRKFVVNLSGCSWIDSTGLGELVKSMVAVMRDGGSLALTEVPPKLLGLLSVTNLTSVFDVYGTEEQAVSSIDATSR